MKRLLTVATLGIVIFATTGLFAREVPFTQEDRERLRNIELKVERLEEGQKSLQKQINDLRIFMLWGFGILFGEMRIKTDISRPDRPAVLLHPYPLAEEGLRTRIMDYGR